MGSALNLALYVVTDSGNQARMSRACMLAGTHARHQAMRMRARSRVVGQEACGARAQSYPQQNVHRTSFGAPKITN